MRWSDTGLTPEEVKVVIAKNTASPDDLDEFLRGVADMDSKKINYHADEMRKDGVTDSFLALCIRLVWGLLVLCLIGATLFFSQALGGI